VFGQVFLSREFGEVVGRLAGLGINGVQVCLERHDVPLFYGANGLGFMPIYCASICDLERVRRRTLSAQEPTLQAKHYVLVPRVFCAAHVP
jgi:hypothetical protein